MYPDLASSSTVDCRGGWLRFVMLCSITISVIRYARTFAKGLGRWTTFPTAFSSKYQPSSTRALLTGSKTSE